MTAIPTRYSATVLDAIRKTCLRRHIKAYQLSQSAGLPQSVSQKLLYGHAPQPSFEVVLRCVKALNLSVDTILACEPPPLPTHGHRGTDQPD